MQAGSVTAIEKNVDRAASALFAMAAGFAGHAWFVLYSTHPVQWAETAALAALAYLLCVRALGLVQTEPRRLPVPVFDVRQIDAPEPEELLLTETLEPAELLLTDPVEKGAIADEPLVLDDILAELEPDSRVVRLFDPAAMPTPGQLNDRIERHLVRDAPPGSFPDASQALHDALAELRRSLR